MPYGIPKEKGGDSEKNVAKMEKCVRAIMSRKKLPKDRAIAIGKAQFGFTKGDDDEED
jgi:hypothetical protein